MILQEEIYSYIDKINALQKDNVGHIVASTGRDIGFERIRRITGYLVGTVDRFNNAKRAEVNDRVKHTGAHFGQSPTTLGRLL